MSITLTPQQLSQLDTAGPVPALLVDPRTNARYVLVPADDYESVNDILRDEREQRAVRAVGLRNAAGRMDDES
jgi:hypothetical protein